MKKRIYRFLIAPLIVFSPALPAEALWQYVNTCKAELGFEHVPELDCFTDGELFYNPPVTPINDYVGYRRLTPSVDLTFACRWASDFPDGTAQSVEMMIHNRTSGKTCYFSAKDADNDPQTEVSARMISPTSWQAEQYWEQPDDFANSEMQCISCHAKGPYIVTERIAPALAKFGLLNNGHDVFAERYSAVGQAFSHWDTLADTFVDTDTCANACHAIALNSTRADVIHTDNFGRSFRVLPSIATVISTVGDAMPPTQNRYSDYRWINRDTQGGTGDHERLRDVKREYPHFHCDSPQYMEARVVGSDYIFRSGGGPGGYDFPDKFRKFSLREGLVCKNSDQSDGQCSDYSTRYLCDGEWTEWFNTDSPGGNYDTERRSRINGLCANPTVMQARVHERGEYHVYAPNDELREFGTTGLVCKNEDQPNGNCSNYVVRFICDIE